MNEFIRALSVAPQYPKLSLCVGVFLKMMRPLSVFVAFIAAFE